MLLLALVCKFSVFSPEKQKPVWLQNLKLAVVTQDHNYFLSRKTFDDVVGAQFKADIGRVVGSSVTATKTLTKTFGNGSGG